MPNKFMLALLLLGASSLSHAAISQWASGVIGFSSQYDQDGTDNQAIQALGAPDTFSYIDTYTAWSPATEIMTGRPPEYLALGFDAAVFATGAVIRETYGSGGVFRIDAQDTTDVWHTVWSGTDTSAPGQIGNFAVNWQATSFATKGLKIFVDNARLPGDGSNFREIDAVSLVGNAIPTAPVPEPETYALMGLGLAGLLLGKRRLALS